MPVTHPPASKDTLRCSKLTADGAARAAPRCPEPAADCIVRVAEEEEEGAGSQKSDQGSGASTGALLAETTFASAALTPTT